MKIFNKNINKRITNIKPLDIASIFVALLVIIPISNFILEGFSFIAGGNFSLGIAGRDEILGTLKLLFFTSLFGGGLGTINGWLLSNCEFRSRKFLRICQLIPLSSPAYLIIQLYQAHS